MQSSDIKAEIMRERGKEGEELAIKLFDSILGIKASNGVGRWGNADIYADYNGFACFIEVKYSRLSYRRKKLNGAYKQWATIHISKPQLEGLLEAEKKGFIAFILVIIKIRGGYLPLVMLPKYIPNVDFSKKPKSDQYIHLSLMHVFENSFPLKLLPLFIENKEYYQLTLGV